MCWCDDYTRDGWSTSPRDKLVCADNECRIGLCGTCSVMAIHVAEDGHATYRDYYCPACALHNGAEIFMNKYQTEMAEQFYSARAATKVKSARNK